MFYDNDNDVFFNDFSVDMLLKSDNIIVRVLLNDLPSSFDAFSTVTLNSRSISATIKTSDLKNNNISKNDIVEINEANYSISNIEYDTYSLSTIFLQIED